MHPPSLKKMDGVWRLNMMFALVDWFSGVDVKERPQNAAYGKVTTPQLGMIWPPHFWGTKRSFLAVPTRTTGLRIPLW
jgi:hypothetical protein